MELEKLTTAQAAEYIGVQPGTLEVWRSTGRGGPRWLKVGRKVVYRREHLDAYLDACTREPVAVAA